MDLYFNLEYLQNAIELTRQNVKAYQDIENIMLDKYKSGKVAPLDYVQAKQSQITEYYQIRYDNGKSEFKDLLEAIYTENAMRENLIQQKYQIIKYENYIYKAMNGRYKKV